MKNKKRSKVKSILPVVAGIGLLAVLSVVGLKLREQMKKNDIYDPGQDWRRKDPNDYDENNYC